MRSSENHLFDTFGAQQHKDEQKIWMGDDDAYAQKGKEKTLENNIGRVSLET